VFIVKERKDQKGRKDKKRKKISEECTDLGASQNGSRPTPAAK
jgi:hypothetical protein